MPMTSDNQQRIQLVAWNIASAITKLVQAEAKEPPHVQPQENEIADLIVELAEELWMTRDD